MRTFKRLLIANRGEIAFRVLRTAKRLGLHCIVPFSDADRATLAVEQADESHRLGPAAVGDSYLNQEKILALALRAGAQAIHPGYGFLSENSGFAARVREAGLIWVGPSAESMQKVSSKGRAKEVAKAASVPTVPGYQGPQETERFLRAAEAVGYPVLLKAVAGGGGRGIRKVSSEGELATQIELARSEAMSAFGDDEILLERFFHQAHHVEVQIMGDLHGNIVHLGERDCSAQRRNQKVIEEAPSPVVDFELREKLTAAAVAIARAVNYTNAGTVEFLVTPSGDFYFLEMNTRLQVEHAVTERVTGLDLVEWQLRIADGEKLPLTQAEIRFEGHAIEARLYAEDPYDQYRPQTGRVEAFCFSPAARVDHFLTSRTEITPYYDSMLAKIIVQGKTRTEAIQSLLKALDGTLISGLKTNQRFLRQILQSEFFQQGTTLTCSLQSLDLSAVPVSSQDAGFAFSLAGLCFYLRDARERERFSGGWSNSTGRESVISLCQAPPARSRLRVSEIGPDIVIEHSGSAYAFEKPRYLAEADPGEVRFGLAGREWAVPVHLTAEYADFQWNGFFFRVENALYAASKVDSRPDPDSIQAPMAGTVVKLSVKPGDPVVREQTLVVVEAMKMQLELKAGRNGLVESVGVELRSQVRTGQVVIRLVAETKEI